MPNNWVDWSFDTVIGLTTKFSYQMKGSNKKSAFNLKKLLKSIQAKSRSVPNCL